MHSTYALVTAIGLSFPPGRRPLKGCPTCLTQTGSQPKKFMERRIV